VILIGIDPGLRSGAIASIDHNGKFVYAYDIPAEGDKIDVKGLRELMFRLMVPGDAHMVCCEHVGVRPGQGIASSGKFMRAFGAIEAVAQLFSDRVEMVLPQAWKKAMGLKADKEESLRMARELFPDALLNLKKHHGKAEALLIAEYARRTFL
jgi:Holliday junction resolvasome RuvABC endonuclease subunit